MPFCTNTTGVSGPSSGPTLSASASGRAFIVTAPHPAARDRPAGRSRAPWRTIFLSPASRVRPRARIASRCAPRATTDTSLPASARRAAKLPPIAPAPNTQIRMNLSPLLRYRRPAPRHGRKRHGRHGEYRGLAYRNNADLAAWLAKRPRRRRWSPSCRSSIRTIISGTRRSAATISCPSCWPTSAAATTSSRPCSSNASRCSARTARARWRRSARSSSSTASPR